MEESDALTLTTLSCSVRDERKKKHKRRTKIPNRPNSSVSLWSIMRNCVGKELTKIPMPVNFNEPLSFLQRLTEDLEYANLLDKAAELTDSCEQMCYVAAYAVSCYSTTGSRTTKPFNPLLGETYECDRRDDQGWWSLAEQVSHHPPSTAHHAEGHKWVMYQDFTMTSRFRGKYLSVTPTGYTHIKFKNTGNHYSYKKITTTVHNIIVGKLWIDNHGEVTIRNHVTGDKCHLKFYAYSYFAPDKARKVTGFVKDHTNILHHVIQGFWDKELEIAKVIKQDTGSSETGTYEQIWRISPPYDNCENMYQFTKLAVELNEEENGVAPTDSRLRHDQRIMEQGNFEEANTVKEQLEEKQRANRRKREEEAAQKGNSHADYSPVWFDKAQDELTGATVHVYKGDYWKCKEKQDWARCPNIF